MSVALVVAVALAVTLAMEPGSALRTRVMGVALAAPEAAGRTAMVPAAVTVPGLAVAMGTGMRLFGCCWRC